MSEQQTYRVKTWARVDDAGEVQSVVAQPPWAGDPICAPGQKLILMAEGGPPIGRGWKYDENAHRFTRFVGENGLGVVMRMPAGPLE